MLGSKRIGFIRYLQALGYLHEFIVDFQVHVIAFQPEAVLMAEGFSLFFQFFQELNQLGVAFRGKKVEGH